MYIVSVDEYEDAFFPTHGAAKEYAIMMNVDKPQQCEISQNDNGEWWCSTAGGLNFILQTP